jgi:mono/diheme cytochrome c family protein
VSATMKTIARVGIVAAGAAIGFAGVAQSAGAPKAGTTKARVTKTGATKAGVTKASATTPAAGLPTPKPGQVVPTTPTPAASGAMTMPGGPESGAAVTASADPAKLAAGKELFTNFSCGSCHALADAGADGHVGPALDGDKGLNHALVVDRVTNGQGPMPAFAGQMTEEEIQKVAAYVVSAAKK